MKDMNETFDFNKALKALQSGQDLTGKNGLLTPLIKQLVEAALKAELSEHLSEKQQPDLPLFSRTVKQPLLK